MAAGRFGSFSTHSRKLEGFPFGSLVAYSSDRFGRPVFFISKMAIHTQNLEADWRASLLVVEPDAGGDPLGAARVTLAGPVEQVAAEAVGKDYFECHPNARRWREFSDFSFYQLYPTGIYVVGGFGAMGWVPVEEYAAVPLRGH